mmetsp:Transcript_7602/g.9745  ORF Transcript_7602/g.9745 Transcript_7602/m.9745 type:complete len:105 (-) Transcript_7602:62-376(-)
MSYCGKKIWDRLAFVCIYDENIENFSLGRIIMTGGLDYSSMKKQNLQCVTVQLLAARGQILLYATWYSIVRKTNEAALCHAVERKFGIGLHLCIFTMKIQNISV